MGAAADAVDEYFRCIRARETDGIRRLFAPDARIQTYWGLTIEGEEGVSNWLANHSYRTEVLSPTVGPPIESGNRCCVEIAVETEDGPCRIVNIFTVREDGRVTDFVAYYRTYDKDSGLEPDIEPGWVRRRRLAAEQAAAN